MASNIVLRLKNTRDKLCDSAAALGASCLCDRDAGSVIEYLTNIEQISEGIYQMVADKPKSSSRSRSRSRSRSPRRSRREKKRKADGVEPRSVYLRYVPGHDAFVGRESTEGEKARLRNIFTAYGRVEHVYVWFYEDAGIKVPMARVVFYKDEDKEYALSKAEEIWQGRRLSVGASKFDTAR